MRVLMTADTVGGVWTYAIELARSLQPYGVEIVLATMGQPVSASQRRQVEGLDNVRLHESTYRLEWMEDAWEDVGEAGRWLGALGRREKPDVVHINGYVHAALSWDCPVLCTAHSCVYSWWQAVHRAWPPGEWKRYRDEVRRGLRAASHVVAPSRAMLSSLAGIYGEVARSSVIPNGIGIAAARPQRKSPIVLGAGRLWDEAKNASALIDIAADVSWPIYLAGEDRANRPLVLGRARRLGHLAAGDLQEWMAHASIFAHPARYEPFGLAAVEAARAGCALVLGDIDSLRENWDGAAVFADPMDRKALKEALERLIGDAAFRTEMAEKAYRRSLDFTPERMAGNYMLAYENLCTSFSSITR